MNADSARVYRAEVLVRFAHCDPAGMVFYPRYLEMFNNLVEDWCRAEGFPFADIQSGRGLGLPAVHVEVDFVAPSVLGEVLAATLSVSGVGASSINLEIELRGPDGARRVRGKLVLVLMDVGAKRAVALPDDLRNRIAAFCAA